MADFGFNNTSRIMAKSHILFPPVPIFNYVKSDAPEAKVVYFHVNHLKSMSASPPRWLKNLF